MILRMLDSLVGCSVLSPGASAGSILRWARRRPTACCVATRVPVRTAKRRPPSTAADGSLRRELSRSPPSPAARHAAAARATPASIEAEIARIGSRRPAGAAEAHFADEYKELMAFAVDDATRASPTRPFGQEMFARFQEIMRSKLKFAAGAAHRD